jgi:hypothetical protein
MDIADRVNQESLALWRKTFNEQDDVLLPLIVPPIKKNCLLFVSLNPSHNVPGIRDFLQNTNFADLNVDDFFNWQECVERWSDNKQKTSDLQTAQEIEIISRINYSFFAKFREIAEELKIDWEHIDLFFFRATSQRAFIERYFNNYRLKNYKRKGDLQGILCSQLELSIKLIDSANPKIIVVANACASKILAQEFCTIFNEVLGCHEINLNNRKVPVFLVSMLTGQRQLDQYSYQRLKWHIGRVINNKVM